MMTHTLKPALDYRKYKHVVKRFGVWGFAFFLVKGILWIMIPFAAHLAFFN